MRSALTRLSAQYSFIKGYFSSIEARSSCLLRPVDISMDPIYCESEWNRTSKGARHPFEERGIRYPTTTDDFSINVTDTLKRRDAFQ